MSAASRADATALCSTVFSGLLLVGGLAGAARGSYISLAAAGGSALALAGLERALASPSAQAPAALAQTALAAVLALSMGDRFARSGKVMPAGLVAGLSAAMTVLYALRAAAAVTRR